MSQRCDNAVVYSAVLRPHRSVGTHAVRWIVGLLATAWTIVGLAFIAAGAWPILPFFGLELVLICGALRLNQRAGNVMEAINLTPMALTVRRVDHWGNQTDFSFPPNWLQVNIEETRNRGSRLELRSHGKSLIIANFLLPHERAELASALRRELHRLTRASGLG